MRCDVLAVGTELLLGQIVDTNSAWIGEQLAAHGIATHLQVKVGDNAAERDEFERVAARFSEVALDYNREVETLLDDSFKDRMKGVAERYDRESGQVELTESERRNDAIKQYSMWMSGGGMLGPIIGGLIGAFLAVPVTAVLVAVGTELRARGIIGPGEPVERGPDPVSAPEVEA